MATTKMNNDQLRALALLGAIKRLESITAERDLLVAEFPELTPARAATIAASASAPYGINPSTGKPYRMSAKARKAMSIAAKRRASTRAGKAHLRRIGRGR